MGRLLHYVYKIPHRGESVKFYRDLGMKSLRHEEFTEGCEAQVRRPPSGPDRIVRLGLGNHDFIVQWTVLWTLVKNNDWVRG